MKSALLGKILLLFSVASPARALLPRSRDRDPNNSNNNNSSSGGGDNAKDILSTQSASGNADCAASSAAGPEFRLSFISYGNYTALPGQGDDDGGLVPRQLVSMTFAAGNTGNGGVYNTVCAFPLGYLSGNGSDDDAPARWVEDASWQACADRRDTDGKHRFTIATGAAFALAERRLSVNQTWFCHDDDGRLVAYTGVANGILNMTCADGGEIGGYHVENCTSPDVSLPITLL